MDDVKGGGREERKREKRTCRRRTGEERETRTCRRKGKEARGKKMDGWMKEKVKE